MLEKLADRIRKTLGGGDAKLPDFSDVDLGPDYPAIKAHVLRRIADTPVGEAPFHHAWIDRLFPEDYFEKLHAKMREFKSPDRMQERKQDNAAFVNRRYPLASEPDLLIRQFQAIWEDADVKRALFEKFYLNPSEEFVEKVGIHLGEFEFVFCEPNRFQNIHIDIPPKVMSFVFYFPDRELTDEEERRNATVLYDRELKPVYGARFRRNSVCIFVPHFYSYHGFSTTIARDVLVMFYLHPDEMREYSKVVREDKVATEGFDGLKGLIADKLKRHPLKEYGTDPERIERERRDCRINAPAGRVMID